MANFFLSPLGVKWPEHLCPLLPQSDLLRSALPSWVPGLGSWALGLLHLRNPKGCYPDLGWKGQYSISSPRLTSNFLETLNNISLLSSHSLAG